MKTLIQTGILLALCILFTACPYESVVPISTPSEKINPKIIGNWKTVKDGQEVYRVSKKDDFNYMIEEFDGNNTLANTYIAFSSTVNGKVFLNLRNEKQESRDGKFMLLKLEMYGDTMIKVDKLTENITEQFNSSEELKNFIFSNMKNSYFYDKEKLNLKKVK